MIEVSTANRPPSKPLLIANINTKLIAIGLGLCFNSLTVFFSCFPGIAGLFEMVSTPEDNAIDYTFLSFGRLDNESKAFSEGLVLEPVKGYFF